MADQLDLPDGRVWDSLELTIGPELHAGHQSRVFRAEGPAGQLVIKLTDERMQDAAFERRVALLHSLSLCDGAVVGPVRLSADHVVRAGGWSIVGYPFVEGRPPNIEDPDDVAAMASALAELHDALETADGRDLPDVAAMRETNGADRLFERGGRRLIHGDFAVSNLVVAAEGIRVIDFDDCGY